MTADPAALPRISVVTATYNRSNVLRYAIESVRAQGFQDWELIVVGDACTDDTSEVVAAPGPKAVQNPCRRLNTNSQSSSRPGRSRGRAMLNSAIA